MARGAIGFLEKPASIETLRGVFHRFGSMLERDIRNVLVIEDDASNRLAVSELIGNSKTRIVSASTGGEGKRKLTTDRFDLVILDLSLPDTTGFELLRELHDEHVELPPVIVYTGRSLSREEHAELSRYAASVVVKGATSPERLLDETSLFLHAVESSMGAHQRKAIRELHDPDRILRGKCVLLVDDDMRNTFALSTVLEENGLDVIMADNGELALSQLDENPQIDIVLMDVMMPIKDGYTTTRELRADPRFAELPVIALTAKAMPEDRQKCLDAGANDYITKPVDMDQLLSLMRVWLFGSS